MAGADNCEHWQHFASDRPGREGSRAIVKAKVVKLKFWIDVAVVCFPFLRKWTTSRNMAPWMMQVPRICHPEGRNTPSAKGPPSGTRGRRHTQTSADLEAKDETIKRAPRRGFGQPVDIEHPQRDMPIGMPAIPPIRKEAKGDDRGRVFRSMLRWFGLCGPPKTASGRGELGAPPSIPSERSPGHK